MATQCRGTKTKRINRHKLAVIQAYIIIGTLVLIGFIGGLVVGRATGISIWEEPTPVTRKRSPLLI